MLIKAVSFFLVFALILSPVLSTRTPGQTSDGPQIVSWTNVVNCATTDGSLEKMAGRDDTSDAGARSQQQIVSGDGFVQFTAGSENKRAFCGLARGAVGLDFVGIDFAIKLTELPVAEVRENNVYKGEVSYRAGDVFRIAIEGGAVRYYKNDRLFYSSLKAPLYPLNVHAMFINLGAKVQDVSIGALTINAAVEWRMYQRDAGHTAYASASRIDTTNVATLSESWRATTGGWVTGTPIVAGGLVYAGAWDGKMYALRESDGSLVWSFTANNTSDNCGASYGIDSTAAISNGKLYFGSAACTLFSLDAGTGAEIWRTQLADASQGFHLWSSPLVFDGKIYVGLASHCDHPCVRGQVVCVSATTGQVLWTFYAAPQGSTGAGVWSSFAIDAARRLVYATSGNYCEGDDTYGDAIFGLNADTGALVWFYKNAARNRDVENLDFGASPVLFDAGSIQALAAGSKDGYCYAVDRATGGLLWSTRVTDGSTTGGIVSSPAAAYGMIFMGASVQSRTGKVVALDQRTGSIVWEASQPAPVIGPATIAGGVVFIGGGDGTIRGYDASTGQLLWSERRGPFYGGISITQNRIFAGSTDRSIYSFALPGANPPPPPPPAPTVAITVTAPVQGDELEKGSKYDVRWSVTGVSRVNVSFSRDGGTSWTVMAENVDASLGTVRLKAKKRTNTALVQVTDTSTSTVFARSGVFRIE